MELLGLSSLTLVLALANCNGCSHVFTSTSGSIVSPKDSNSFYPDNVDCTYMIRSNVNAHYIHFLWDRFDLEKNYDYLYIDNQNFTGGLQAWYRSTYYFNNYIILRFTSDGSNHEYGGFKINYRVIQGDVSSTIYTMQTGLIESPKETNSSYYPDNARFLYIVRGSFNTKSVRFSFETFYLEKGNDFLYLGAEKLTGNKTGYEVGWDFCTNTTLLFTSDSSLHQYAGFKIRYWLLTDCMTGYYGLNCSSRCSSGCSDVCNKETGSCHCRVGWTGESCDEACPSGTYDPYCTKTCSPGCVDGSCNKEDGSCSCRSGYTGDTCRNECQAGHYGVNCTSGCSSGCSDDCDKESGRCTCKPGWTDTKCETACPSGTYDSYCTKTCNPGCLDGSCDKEDGSCSFKYSNSTTQNGKLIAGVTGGSLGFILLVIALILIYCFIRKKKAHETKHAESVQRATVNAGEEVLYDMPIEENSKKRARSEGLKYSTDQRSGTSQPVPHVLDDEDNETEYVNVAFPKQKRAKKAAKGGKNKGQQCYENYAMESKDRNK